MSIEVLMPQMGESITEGTLTKWLKKEGDAVERDEDLFEISTDKVDTVVPAPASGTLEQIKVKEGDTVPINTVVALLAGANEAAAASEPRAKPEPAAQQASAQPPGSAPEATRAAPAAASQPTTDTEQRKIRSSPLVRRIAREHDVDLGQVPGSGSGGRITKSDILAYVEQRDARPAASQPTQAQPASTAPQRAAAAAAPRQLSISSQQARIEPLSTMRKKIAEHMVDSRRTSAHVTTVFEIDMAQADRLRKQHKAEFAERGAKLTYTVFIAKALVDSLRAFPVLNASMDDDNVYYHNSVNLGIAVALDWGLIVPVIQNADSLNMLGLARAINDLGERARNKKLDPSDVQGGTFTITNPGIYGGLFGTPIISQPQVAILGVGTIEKRPVVIDDAIAIRPRAYFGLSFDHRLIDGAVADQFMADLKQRLENITL